MPYTTSANCSCCIILRTGNYKGGQFCRQASSSRNALFYLGLFAKQLDCSQSSIFSWDRSDILRLTVTGMYCGRFLPNHPRPLSSFDTYARWQPVTQSARSRWSYGKIEDCEQSTKQLPVLRALKVFFPSSDESLLSMLSAVNFVNLSGFRLGGTMVPFFWDMPRIKLPRPNSENN